MRIIIFSLVCLLVGCTTNNPKSEKKSEDIIIIDDQERGVKIVIPATELINQKIDTLKNGLVMKSSGYTNSKTKCNYGIVTLNSQNPIDSIMLNHYSEGMIKHLACNTPIRKDTIIAGNKAIQYRFIDCPPDNHCGLVHFISHENYIITLTVDYWQLFGYNQDFVKSLELTQPNKTKHNNL